MRSDPRDVRVKRVYEPAGKDDGARVLVDRIWPRGISKDHAALTAWLKDVAPSAELRHWFGHDPSRWEAFQHRYRLELQANENAVSALLELAAKGTVTLLYAAHDVEHNNALALRDYVLASKTD